MEKSNTKIRIIVGIGNPEKGYGMTYHNVGKMFINYIFKNKLNGFSNLEQLNNSLYIKNYKIIFAKTTLYMNQSGKSILELIKKFKLKTNEILIAHDDSDIYVGNYKITFGQSSAGHKGIENIINTIGKNFWRCKIGIREKTENWEKSENFVLKKISEKKSMVLEKTFNDAYNKIIKNMV